MSLGFPECVCVCGGVEVLLPLPAPLLFGYMLIICSTLVCFFGLKRKGPTSMTGELGVNTGFLAFSHQECLAGVWGALLFPYK